MSDKGRIFVPAKRAGSAHLREDADELPMRRVVALALSCPIAVDGINPQHGLGLLNRLDIEIDRDRLAVAAHQHALENLVPAGIDLLMRHVWRYEYEIARIRFRGELAPLAPAHARPPAHHVDDAFQMT